MNPKAMTPHGRALAAYFGGDKSAEILIRRDDGVEVSVPASHFFRGPEDFTRIESLALARCRGQILDVGAGSGLHSLALQSSGHAVTAIDISPEAVSVMKRRGVRVVEQADLFEYQGGPFDTLLMLGHGIGIVEDLAGLRRFLTCARRLARTDGQILLDSLDVSATSDEKNIKYQEANRAAGRYIGEIRFQLEFKGEPGSFCGWLHIDPPTLTEQAAAAGWVSETLLELKSGEHLSRLLQSSSLGSHWHAEER